MSTFRLSAAMIRSSHHYTLQLRDQVTLGEVAQYLSQCEPYLAVSTLELARPVLSGQRLQDIDVQTGDRLIALMQPARQAVLPPPLRPGDKTLRFSLGAFEINSRGKRGILVGKPDEAQHFIPDIDLRYFVRAESLEFISRGCLWLNFDEGSKTWYVSRMGQTRVMIDEFELGSEKIPLNDDQWLHLFRETDNPRLNTSQAIGHLRLTIEEVQAGEDIVTLEPGHRTLNVHVGSERETHILRVSRNLQIGQVMGSLALHNQTPLTSEVRLYVSRLLSPDMPVHSLHLGDDELLYAALDSRYVRNMLVLHDVHSPGRAFTLLAGLEDAEKSIGCRLEGHAPDPSLDVDLYGMVESQGVDPGVFTAVSPYQGRIVYRAAENTWSIGLAASAQVPMFVNDMHITGSTLIPLTTGDVLSFGPSVTHYYVRLEVEITAKTD